MSKTSEVISTVPVSNVNTQSPSSGEYQNLQTWLWNSMQPEINYYKNFKMRYSKDAALLQLFVERERIFYFLAGLNVEFDQVCVPILGKESLPPLNEVFSLIWAEEGQRTVMLDNPTSKSLAFATTTPSVLPIKNNGSNNNVDSRKNERPQPSSHKEALEIEVISGEDKIWLIVMMISLQLLPTMVVSTRTRLKDFEPFSLQ
ncbi:hypothetical protein CK203_113267 [Vitis vinifera]|uniref:Uncharacterized protein n=1 Tax=Vitis vinifera TaxID=29760 RepID=A0A438EL94_VITVI|nr:hypothetical protein CK203_113267 [Vitis vinifera]